MLTRDELLIVCADCRESFDFSRERVFFERKGWPPATRCVDCRRAKQDRWRERQALNPRARRALLRSAH